MRKFRVLLLIISLLLYLCLFSGCWNYREIDETAVVIGSAIDKGTEKRYELTIEIVKVSSGKESKTEPRIFSAEGDTIFEAVRNQIALTGKRLYWSHAKLVIISQEIAKEGIVSILDWYYRDAENRTDINILISKEKTAKEILKCEVALEDILSFTLDEMIDSEESLSKAPRTELWEIANDILAEGITATAPTVSLKEADDKKVPSILGMAIFKEDKLTGFLDGEDARTWLFIKDQIKGGVLVQNEQGKEGTIPVSLEILVSKTKIKPLIDEEKIEMIVQIDLQLAIDEIQGEEDFMKNGKTQKLENDTGEQLKKQVEDLVRKVQLEFGIDIFGFGSKIHGDNPKGWKKLSKDWNERFKEVKVTVIPKVLIRNSATMSHPLKIGD